MVVMGLKYFIGHMIVCILVRFIQLADETISVFFIYLLPSTLLEASRTLFIWQDVGGLSSLFPIFYSSF